MKQFVLAFGLMMVAIPALGQKTTVKTAGDELAEAKSSIEKGNAQWSEGWFKRDPKMVSLIFAEDGVQLTLSGKVVKGRQQIMERLKTAMDGAEPGVKVTVTTVNVWLDGDIAYETGKYKYEYVEKGKPGIDEGRYVTAWKNKRTARGNWQWTWPSRPTSSGKDYLAAHSWLKLRKDRTASLISVRDFRQRSIGGERSSLKPR